MDFGQKSKIPALKQKNIKLGTLNKNFNFSLFQLVIFAAIFAAIGGIIIWRSLAAAPVVGKLEAEQMQSYSTTTINSSISSSINSSSDDAEQFSNQSMYLDSSDLEMVDDPEYGGYGQKIGLRFTNVSIPRGATINKAYIQFRADESQSNTTSLAISGQASDSPNTFTAAYNDIGNRIRTASKVNWPYINAWTTGYVTSSQQTPDLKTIVQEIVNRSGWNTNNAMVFIIDGSGHRTADAYDDTEVGRQTARLVVDYSQQVSVASIVDDSNASGSKALLMSSSGVASGNINLLSNSESLNFTARGTYCNGDWPIANLLIDGQQVLSVKVASSTWSTYPAGAVLPSGNHSVSVNYSVPDNCGRLLYVDAITLFGPNVPPPTVSLSASPLSLVSGNASNLTWNTTNATSCNASGGWSGVKATAGTQSTGPLYTNTTFSLSCSGISGSASASVTVNITAVPASSNSSLGVLRINYNQSIPADLTRYKLLILDAARGSQVSILKAKYPQLKIIGYKNLAFAIDYSSDANGNAGVPWPTAQANPSWFLKDAYGNKVSSIYFTTHWFMDLGSTAYQDAWYNNVYGFLKSAPWDGVFMDDTNADIGWHVGNNYAKLAKYPSRDSYRAAVRSMLASVGPRIKSAGYLAIPNVGASWDQPDVWADWATLTSGAMREHYLKWGEVGNEPVFRGSDWKIHTDAQRAVENAGRMFVALTYGTTPDAARQTYIRASFLLFWQPADGSVAMWSVNDGAEFTADIGLPVSAATQNGAIWSRQFEKGLVSVDTNAGTASITLKP